jgi:uncharacterized protein YdhG (YjbR/CyaY superfamily)
MKATPTKFKTVDEYISTFPVSTQKILKDVRKTIHEAAPQAEDVISYNMPALKFKGVLVYYAAYEKHIGFYPTNSGIEAFKDQLRNYKFSKGAIQFPIDEPIPFNLITRIVKFRMKEVQEKEKAKKNLA